MKWEYRVSRNNKNNRILHDWRKNQTDGTKVYKMKWKITKEMYRLRTTGNNKEGKGMEKLYNV